MNPFSHKLLAILTISGFLVAPISVWAQPVRDGDAYGDFLNQNSSTSIIPGLGDVIDFYGSGGTAGQSNLFEQAMGDRTACEAEAPKANTPTSAIGRGVAEGVAQSAIEAIEQGLPENLISYVQSDLPQRLSNNLQNKLGSEFERRLEAEMASGLRLDQINETVVNRVLRESIDSILQGSVRESVQDSIPRAISRSVTEGLPTNLNNNINSSLRYSMEGPFRDTLNGFLGGDNSVGETLIDRVLGSMSDQIGNAVMNQLEGSMDDIVSSVTDGVMGSLDSSLNQITGDLTGSVDQIIGTLDGSLQDITDSLTGALTDPIAALTDNLTGSIDDLVGSLNGPLQQLTGSFDQITNDLVGSITGPISGLTDSLTGSINDLTSQLTQSITGPINGLVDQVSGQMENIMGSAMKPITDIVQKPAELLEQATGNLITKIPGLGSIPGIGGLLSSSVPVHEVGDLLQVTKDIKGIEEESRDVLIEICGHIKDVRRIQLAFEQKEFVQDAEARQAASDLAEEYRSAYKDKFIPEGYTVDGGEQKGSLIIENYGDLYLARRNEASKIYLGENLKKSADIFKDATQQILTKQEAESKGGLASTITKSEYDKLKNPANLNSADLTDLLVKAFDPTRPNNPGTSYFLNNEALQRAKDRAEELARDESQSTGFNPVRECLKVADDGKSCLEWKIITPGSIIKEDVANISGSRLRQLEQADEVTDVGEDTQVPSVEETEQFETVDSTARNTPNFNGNFAQNIFSGLLARLRGIFNNGGNNGGGNGGGDTDTGEAPEVNLTFTSPTVAQINGGAANAAFINLTTSGADKCVAGNNWLSLRDSGNRVQVAIAQGVTVATNGSIKMSLPLNFSFRLERTRDGEVTTFTPVSSVNASLTQQVSSLNLGNAQVEAGDTFKLIVRSINQEQSVSVTAGSANAAAVVTALQQAVSLLSATSDQGKEFKALRLTFTGNQSGEGFITATIDPIYRLTCSNSNGSTNASVTITRWALDFSKK